MIEHLIQLDHQIFFAINNGLSNAFFDFLMPILRNKYTWIPLYILIIFFAVRLYKTKGLYLVAFLGIAVGLADYGSAKILKPAFERIRPCNNEVLKENVISRVPCGSGLSFPSTHASDHFSIAVFFITIFYYRWKYILHIAILWAGAISFAQVYVGVHFPVDITFGALFGSTIGYIIAKLYQKYIILPY
jgi:membrane-associated phospholipid phosphatase